MAVALTSSSGIPFHLFYYWEWQFTLFIQHKLTNFAEMIFFMKKVSPRSKSFVDKYFKKFSNNFITEVKNLTKKNYSTCVCWWEVSTTNSTLLGYMVQGPPGLFYRWRGLTRPQSSSCCATLAAREREVWYHTSRSHTVRVAQHEDDWGRVEDGG